MLSFDLNVNGNNYAVEADGQMPLLWVLRDLLGLTGTKFSCGEGLCGSCTVLVDGTATRSCIFPVERAAGKNILTIEGLSVDGSSAAKSVDRGTRDAVRLLSGGADPDRHGFAGSKPESER